MSTRTQALQAAFQRLRHVLRLRHDALRQPERPEPAPPALAAARLEEIADQVQAFRKDLQERVRAAPADTRPEAVVLAYLDRYRDQLFGHPAARDDAGRVVAVVARTNNPAEHFFSQAKRKLRRRLGRAHLGRDMQDQPAEARAIF